MFVLTMDYLAYLETIWQYLPYILYTFAFVTLLPKSLSRMKAYANVNYEANRHKYHRCYGPDYCCHVLEAEEEALPAKPKQRRAVTRVYPKRNGSLDSSRLAESNVAVRRQVKPSAIQTHTHVNQIAKMFENGHTNKKINRVTPTILPVIRLPHNVGEERQEELSTKKQSRLSQLLQNNNENNENSANLLNQATAASSATTPDDDMHNANGSSWCSEPILVPLRRKRVVPRPLIFGGNSAMPSTASPVAWSSTTSALSSPTDSPVLSESPPLLLNMKSSLEDIFAAIARSAESGGNFMHDGCNTLSPVTSIDDILSQRRLSRPLSAYSISDLLNEESVISTKNDPLVDSFLLT